MQESLDSIEGIWRGELARGLRWDCLFVTPPWLRAWWETFGSDRELCLRTVRDGDSLLGFAPLMIEAGEARFMGDPDVCDYLDFAVSDKSSSDFFGILLRHLRESGVSRLSLGPVRPNSATSQHLFPFLQESGYALTISEEDVCYEVALPESWEGFLARLKGKQRHELRRKLRRLEEAGDIRFRVLDDPAEIEAVFPRFLEMFRASRPDKADFMTDRMGLFFQRLTDQMSLAGRLKLEVLEIDGVQVAAVYCFDDGHTIFLYNNGYDPSYRAVNVGLLSKVLSLRDSIERGRRCYDFLKGAEVYKQRLGAEPVSLYRCRANLV